MVLRAVEEKFDVLGIRRGWGGLLYLNPDDPASRDKNVLELNPKVVRTIDRTGGTFLHTSRVNPARVKPKNVPDFMPDVDPQGQDTLDLTPHILRVIERLGLDALITIGGDDTLSYSERLYREGVPVVAIPKTMDNDVYGTDYCIGFSTAVTRSVEFIHQLRTCAGSHERITIVELFGRNSGETSLISAYLSGADRAIISEVPFDMAKLADLLVADKMANPSNYTMMTISEGARPMGGEIIETGPRDAYGHRRLGGIGEYVSEQVKALTEHKTIYQRLAYMMRSGAPDALDLMVALNYGNIAMDLITEQQFNRMVALRQGTYTHVPLKTVMEGVRRVDVDELYDRETYRPKARRVEGKPMFLH
jgi:6-phosphofructokinase 1